MVDIYSTVARVWSGRRGSNPRPTAWKAVTLPLSYSRLSVPEIPNHRPQIPTQSKVVAREGLEPSKPLGRQIYSLLRLTASLPRQLSVCWKRVFSSAYLVLPMELAKGFEPPTC